VAQRQDAQAPLHLLLTQHHQQRTINAAATTNHNIMVFVSLAAKWKPAARTAQDANNA
jgi:hypothetical protein